MSLSAQDAFRLLGIEWESERDLDLVEESLVKRQYRRLALKLHPDKNKSDPSAELKFNQLKQAHDELMNAEKRRVHVQTLRASLQRKQEQSILHADRRKFAEDLGRRETEWNTQTGSNRLIAIRAQHRMLIEQLEANRIKSQSNVSQAFGSSLGGPDDSNTSLDYWINYGLSEPLDVRKEKAERFTAFISQKISN